MLLDIHIVFLFFIFSPWFGILATNIPSDISHRVPNALRDPINDREFDIWEVYLPTEGDPDSTCGRSLQKMKETLNTNSTTWAHQMMDSWGKHIDGYLFGVEPYFGVYDECRRTLVPEEGFHGRTCKVIMRIFLHGDQPGEKDHMPIPEWIPIPVQNGIDDILNGALQNNSDFPYITCIPSTCSEEDLTNSLSITFNNTDVTLSSISCHDDTTPPDFTAADIGYICLLSVFGFLLIAASLVDIYIQKTENKTLGKGGVRYLLPFSAFTNLQKLFNLNTEKIPGNITCLHGMRVLSMTWVVFCHQQSVSLAYFINFFTMIERFSSETSILYQAILNGFPSVDTFFFMSGFLMSYSVFRQYERTKTFNIGLFYFHRLLRLLPPIGIVCGLFATIPRFFIVGPTADYWEYWRSNCINGWWRDILFLDNIAIRFEDTSMCIGQCWYLGVDTQIYLIAPLILIPILYKENLGLIWLYFVTMVSIITPGIVTYVHDMPPSPILGDPKMEDVTFLRYNMPWCRAGPILIGIWLGYFFIKQGKAKTKLVPWQVLMGWTVAALTGLMVIFGLYSYNSFFPKAQYDVMTAVIFGALHRPAWAAALSWVVFACYNGYGGFIDDFLSHPIWQPMSRLTYAIYLVALPLQYAIVYNARSPYYFTYYNVILQTVGALVVSVIPAVLVSITAESPVIGIERLIFKRPDPRTPEPKKTETEELKGEENKTFKTEEMKEFDGHEKLQGHSKRSVEAIITAF